MAGEMLGPILLSIHNLTYYQRLLAAARQAIVEDRFAAYRAEKLAGWRGMTEYLSSSSSSPAYAAAIADSPRVQEPRRAPGRPRTVRRASRKRPPGGRRLTIPLAAGGGAAGTSLSRM